MGINDPNFPLGIVGDHLASAAGGWEPQRTYNWLFVVSGIGSAGGFGASASVGGSLSGGIGNAGAFAGATASAGVSAGAGGGGVIELALDSSSLPTHGVEEIELPYLNERRYVAGRAMYEAIPLVVKDMVDIGVATACKAWFGQVHNSSTHKVGLARDYKKTADILLISPEGSLIRTWRLYGCWPTAVNYGELDMNSNDVVRIQMNLRFDRAEALDF